MSIEAINITKTFGRFKALDRVSLNVPQGKLVSLLGPSGSGKTTLLRILAGLDFPDPGTDGSVRFHGEEVTGTPVGKRGVGFVFQHYALFRHMTVGENVAFGMRAKPRRERPDEAAIRGRVRELLALVQLDGLERRYPSELSGGQRQRVALARALAVRPRVLLLDEPFGALDAKVRKDLRRWLRTFQEEIGVTTVFVTHDQEEALELADEVVVMNNARIEQVGDPQTVYDHPSSPFVIEFLGNVNQLAPGYRPKLQAKRSLYVRPHDIDIVPMGEDVGSGSLEAKVLHIFAAGNYGRVTLQRTGTGETLEAEVARDRLRDLDLHGGENVRIRFRHTRVFEEKPDGGQELVFLE